MIVKVNNYIGRIKLDDSGTFFHGEVLNMRDVVTFQAKTAIQIKKEMKKSIAEYISFCKEVGKTPEKPYSGNMPLRMKPETHRKLSELAALEGSKINPYVVSLIEAHVEEKEDLFEDCDNDAV